MKYSVSLGITEVVVYHSKNDGVPPEKIGWLGLFLITGMYSIFCFGGLVCLVGLNWHNKLSLLELLIFGIVCGVITGIVMDFFMRKIDFEGYRVYLGLIGRHNDLHMVSTYDLENYTQHYYDPEAGDGFERGE